MRRKTRSDEGCVNPDMAPRFIRIRNPDDMRYYDPETSDSALPCEKCGKVAKRVEEHVVENGSIDAISTGFECQNCGHVTPA